MKIDTYLLYSSIFIITSSITYRFLQENINFSNNSCSEYWAYPIWFLNWKCHYNPDIAAEAPDIIARYGFQFETHELLTSDDYILTLFRIFPKIKSDKTPVFLHHGISSNTNLYISNGNNSLAFKLANRGHEVWLGNYRGGYYSQRHKHLSISDYKYWEYSLEELGLIDIREQLKYIANMTGNQGDIIYIGYSLSTGLFFMYASEYPEEAKSLVQGTVMIAPGAYIKDVSLFMDTRVILTLYMNVFRIFGYNGFFYNKPLKTIGFNIVCRLNPWMCRMAMEYCAGKTDNIATDDLLMVMHNSGDGTSYKILDYTFQAVQEGEFHKFNFGEEVNLKKYGVKLPPSYNMSKINVPIYMFYGENDIIATPKNIERLYSELTVSEKFVHKVLNFNHIDFLLGRFSSGYFFDDLLVPVLDEKFN